MSSQSVPVKFEVPSLCRNISIVLMIIGVVTFALGLMKDPVRIWSSYLTAFFFFFSLALGGLFFSAIQHVTNARWSVAIRRFAESLTAFLPYAGVLALILVFLGSQSLYVWLQPEVVAADPLIQKKSAYLNQNFFYLRAVVFFGLWLLFKELIVSRSLKQDQNHDSSITESILRPSIIFLIVFAFTYSLFSVDLLMSIDPHWFSTMFGVYCFAGLFQSSLSMIILLTLWLQRRGVLQGYVNESHIHDLGKFLFAFTVFYAYIGFSQFMLIWYANLPEETEFFAKRGEALWYSISLSLLVLKFVVPFLILLPRGNKRDPKFLIPVCVLLLIMQYVDNYWLIYPNFNGGHVVFSFWEVGMGLGMLGVFLFAVYNFLGKHSVIPIGDPGLSQSLHHHT